MACRLILLVLLTVAVVACSSTTSHPEITATTMLERESPTPSQPVSTLEPTASVDISTLTGRIVFTAGLHPQEDIYVINADGSGLTQLTTAPAADYDPSWSPDGTRIAFRSRRDGNDEIYVMNADGSGQTNLTNHPARDLSPAWSPDGTLIAFASDRDGAGSTLWIMNADGSNPRRIGDTGGEYPAWSPDGKKLAFDYQTFSDSEFDIWVINVDGSGAGLLAGGPTSQQGPAWSPDGSQIVFESELEAENNFDHIWLMNADGSGQERRSQGHGDRPVWSPDGRYILFVAGGLYLMPVDGSEVIQLPVTGLGELAFPDWTK